MMHFAAAPTCDARRDLSPCDMCPSPLPSRCCVHSTLSRDPPPPAPRLPCPCAQRLFASGGLYERGGLPVGCGVACPLMPPAHTHAPLPPTHLCSPPAHGLPPPRAVVDSARTTSGLLFGLPVVLDTDREDLVVGDRVLLTHQGQVRASPPPPPCLLPVPGRQGRALLTPWPRALRCVWRAPAQPAHALPLAATATTPCRTWRCSRWRASGAPTSPLRPRDATAPPPSSTRQCRCGAASGGRGGRGASVPYPRAGCPSLLTQEGVPLTP